MELIDPSEPARTTVTTNSTSISTGATESISTKSTATPQQKITSALKHRRKTSPPKDPPPVIHPPLDSYKFRAVIELSIKIPKTDQVYPILWEKILMGLSFIQQFGDPSAAFLPKPGSSRTVPMYNDATFPLDQFTTGMHYFVYPNEYSLYPNKQESRMVRLSTTMGFTIDPRSFLHVMKIDLMGIGATFEVKLEQALDTCSRIVFLGAPQNISKAYAKQVMDLHVVPLEKELMAADPITYPVCIHGGPWPSYSMVIEQPGGMFEQVQRGMSRAPPARERRSLQLLCAAEVYDRLAALIKEAKTRGIWTHEFGNGQCYPVEVVTSDSSKIQKENYKTMVELHGAAQLGLGNITFSGVKDDRVERIIQRLPDISGPRAPVSISLRHILRQMRFNGSPLWVCLIRTDKKQGWDIYYNGLCPITISYVDEFLKCPAAQIMYWLLKRGFVKEQVEDFIRDSFNLAQCALCAQARYNANVKLAQVETKEEDMDIMTASRRKGSIIKPDLGLTEERIKIRQQQLQATVCNLGKYNFSRPQDIRTVRGNASAGEWSQDASLGKSIYRLGHCTTGEDVEGNSDSEEEMDDEELDDDAAEEDVEGSGTASGGKISGNRHVHFSMALPGGDESERLILPETEELTGLRFPGLHNIDIAGPPGGTDSVDSEAMETEDTPSGRFASAVWNLAPENYKLIFGVLAQLELEIMQARGIQPPIMDIPAGAKELITDELRHLLVAGADETDLFDFVHAIQEAMDELRAADIAAQSDLTELFRKRSREESHQEEDDTTPDIADPKNNRLSIDGLPGPSFASLQHTNDAGGTVNPQGSLLSALSVTQVTGDVETSPAGGVPG